MRPCKRKEGLLSCWLVSWLCVSAQNMTYWWCQIQIERLKCRQVVNGGNSKPKYKSVFGLWILQIFVIAVFLYAFPSLFSPTT